MSLSQNIKTTVGIIEQVWGSPFASMLLTAALKRFSGELTAEDKAQLDANYAEGLAARADAFERANRPV